MKMMRGFADPITLGFILAAVIGGAGAMTAANTSSDTQVAAAQKPVATATIKMANDTRTRPAAPVATQAEQQ
ncbi:MAG TPA: hypothetical protein PLE99_05125 [Candidatus Thiothrix moscowensis]|uniref:hypothetical protein n=1 Tax=unclassified Thiothrix TaxID=2636184 RepID=UPI0025D50CA3|nr:MULTISPECIES: hypothetical protein [unclassified Thiothrix]HRJ52127.1 hypothetical protein [Candidatus Thiothrix moscowensis]HRJ92362.1 hypothetical protein [Candidatus Thiothrix moscowensis]